MKIFYRIFLLIVVFILLSTFNPKELNLISKKDSTLFQVQNIEIKNNILIDERIIREKLNNIYNKNIFFLKQEDLEYPMKEIDFLEKIEVKKKYPHTIIISIFETEPVALIIKNELNYILDSSSNLILFKDDINIKELPNVFGEGAEKNFIFFLDKLKKNNFPIKQIKRFYFFQVERWDLNLINNKTIKFPNDDIDEAIIKSIELLNREDFKNYNTIDLRVDGKIIVE